MRDAVFCAIPRDSPCHQISESSLQAMPATSPRRWPDDQQTNYRAVGRCGIAGGAPNLRNLGIAQYPLARGNALIDRQSEKRIGTHGAAFYRPGKSSPPIRGGTAGHGSAPSLSHCLAILALPAPCQRIQGTHDGRSIQILGGVVQVVSESVMQCAHRLSGVARAPGSKVKPLPILDQHPQREPVTRAPCALGCRSFFALVRWVTPLATSPIMAAAASRAWRATPPNRRPAVPATCGRASCIGTDRVRPPLAVTRTASPRCASSKTSRSLRPCSVASFSIFRSVSFTISPVWPGSAAGPRTPSGPRRMTYASHRVGASQKVSRIIGQLQAGNFGVRDGACRQCRLVAARQNLLWIRRSVVRVHPAVPRLAPQARKVADDDRLVDHDDVPATGAKLKERQPRRLRSDVEATNSYGFAPSTAITLYFAYFSPILRAASYSGE